MFTISRSQNRFRKKSKSTPTTTAISTTTYSTIDMFLLISITSDLSTFPTIRPVDKNSLRSGTFAQDLKQFRLQDSLMGEQR